MKKDEIAIFGGSFNPIHKGHESIIKHLIENFTQVLIIPVDNYMKENDFLNLSERIYLIKKIYEKQESVIVLDNNLKDPKFTYTYHVIESVKSTFPDKKINLVFGSDYTDISNWKNSDFILKNVNLYKIKRKGEEDDGLQLNIENISSTEIRNDLEKYSKYLNSIVFDYIKNK